MVSSFPRIVSIHKSCVFVAFGVSNVSSPLGCSSCLVVCSWGPDGVTSNLNPSSSKFLLSIAFHLSITIGELQWVAIVVDDPVIARITFVTSG
jgi:hypothetical protein